MRYKQESPEWQQIVKEHPTWFSSWTMEFWNSEIYWETLTPTEDGGWKFISSEDDATRTHTRYTIRKVIGERMEDIGEFQAYGTIAEAIRAL